MRQRVKRPLRAPAYQRSERAFAPWRAAASALSSWLHAAGWSGAAAFGILAACNSIDLGYLTAGSDGGAAGRGTEGCGDAGAGCGGSLSGAGRGGAGGNSAGHAGTAGTTMDQGGAGATDMPIAGAGTLPGGASGMAGAAGASGAPGPTEDLCEGDDRLYGPATRPQLTAEAAEEFTIDRYLAMAGTLGELTSDPWDPTSGIGDASSFVPDFTVASDGSGTHTTVQAAVDEASASSEVSRIFILLKPGTYREVVCIDSPNPITLYGKGSDATSVEIAFDNYGGKLLDEGPNPCAPPVESDTYGLSASATFAVNSNGVQLKNLTIANDYIEGSDPWASGQQALAMLTEGDRLAMENVRILGNQNTTLFTTPDPEIVSRVYIKDSYIAGDVQFITGRATLVIDSSEIRSLTSRVTRPLGSTLAAATAAENPYGFLIWQSQFTVDTNSDSDWVLMGRSWDENTEEYVAGTSPNGQIVIRESTLDSHIRQAAPWGNALETVRLFNCNDNRLYEYDNSGPGSLQ